MPLKNAIVSPSKKRTTLYDYFYHNSIGNIPLLVTDEFETRVFLVYEVKPNSDTRHGWVCKVITLYEKESNKITYKFDGLTAYKDSHWYVYTKAIAIENDEI